MLKVAHETMHKSDFISLQRVQQACACTTCSRGVIFLAARKGRCRSDGATRNSRTKRKEKDFAWGAGPTFRPAWLRKGVNHLSYNHTFCLQLAKNILPPGRVSFEAAFFIDFRTTRIVKKETPQSSDTANRKDLKRSTPRAYNPFRVTCRSQNSRRHSQE